MENQELNNNRTAAMIGQILDPCRKGSVGRLLPTSGWRKLPAVSKFELGSSEYNEILKNIGINLKVRGKPSVKLMETRKANRYMKHQLIRIRKLKGTNPKLAWTIALSCIRRSKCFRSSAFNYVLSGWYYNMHHKEVYKISRKLDKIIKTEDNKIIIKRVYIPKPNGKVRPLGVPSPEWRVYLHMLNNMFVEILGDEISKDQHAYIPGRGVKTAWQSIMEKVDKFDYIYETDLKGYFDTVDSLEVIRCLEEKRVPKKVISMVKGLCLTVPQLQKVDRVEESVYRKREEFLKSHLLHESEIGRSLINQFIIDHPTISRYKELILNSKSEGWNKVMIDYWKASLGHTNNKLDTLFDGVPQGSPLSPFLSNLPLSRGYLAQAEHVSYADDHIFFLNQPRIIMDNPAINIKHNEEKCGWLKFNGKLTEKGIKFLGMRLTDTFSSETRKGTKAEIPKELLSLGSGKVEEIPKEDLKSFSRGLMDLSNNLSGNYNMYLRKLMRKNIFGFIMSCMQINDFKNAHSREDIRKTLETYEAKSNINSMSLGSWPNETKSSTFSQVLLELQGKMIRKEKPRRTKAGRPSISRKWIEWLTSPNLSESDYRRQFLDEWTKL